MVHPWKGPRHRSWASDTVVTAVLFVILLAATIWTDMNNGPAEPPAYLTGLLGAAGAALFGAAGSDKNKREREIAHDASTAKRRTLTLNEDQIRNEAKIDALLKLVKEQHPHVDIPDPLIPDAKKDQGDS